MHDQEINYKCNVYPCDRTYSSISTFRLHHRKHFIHHPSIDSIRITNREENQPVNNQVVAVQSDNEQPAVEREQPIFERERETPIEPTTSSNVSPTMNINFLTNELKQLNLGFTLKWLSKSDLPRKMAFELRSDIEKYYLDPFRKAFQLASVVEPIGNFTKSILNEFEQPDEESEYMFIKRLKQQDLLSEPDLFTKDNQIRNEPQLVSNKKM